MVFIIYYLVSTVVLGHFKFSVAYFRVHKQHLQYLEIKMDLQEVIQCVEYLEGVQVNGAKIDLSINKCIM